METVLLLAMFGGVLGFAVADLLGIRGDGQLSFVLAGWVAGGAVGLFHKHERNRHA